VYLSFGEFVEAKASRVILWDRKSSNFIAQKLDRSGGEKNIIEYASYFSENVYSFRNGLQFENVYISFSN
jgi:hypothetical protein